MSIRTFRNKVLRYKFGLTGPRPARGPRRVRRSLHRLAAIEEAKREARKLDSPNKAARSRKPSSSTSKPGILGRAVTGLRRFAVKAFSKKGN